MSIGFYFNAIHSRFFHPLSGITIIFNNSFQIPVFRFLLERESKESILRSFDMPIIAHYFPEYEQRIGSYLPE